MFKNHYIHKDKTVEFFGNHPVLTEKELINIVCDLSKIEDNAHLTKEKEEELLSGFEDYDGHDQWQDQLQDIKERREEEREANDLESRI